jgi:hypothetical protein
MRVPLSEMILGAVRAFEDIIETPKRNGTNSSKHRFALSAEKFRADTKLLSHLIRTRRFS